VRCPRLLEAKDSCLQCHVRGLKCSFTSPKRLVEEGKCSRCARNREEFCVEREGGGWVSSGVEDGVVREMIEGWERERVEKVRWALPLPVLKEPLLLSNYTSTL
jgi:hypothetical protein